jgi:hypothetical protein
VRELEAALTAGDKAALEKLVDYSALLDRALACKDPPPAMKTQLSLFRGLMSDAYNTAGIPFLLLEGPSLGIAGRCCTLAPSALRRKSACSFACSPAAD